MPASPGPTPRGLSAAELEIAARALAQAASAATVVDAVALLGTGGHDDLLLVLQPPDADRHKLFVHVALGGPRARLTLTTRRFGRDRRARGPGADLLARELQDATLTAVEPAAGERRCVLRFAARGGERTVCVELFGTRGLWALCDEQGVALTMSRPVETAVRTLRRGDIYAPPPPAGARAEQPPRFAADDDPLRRIDEHFGAIDIAQEERAAIDELRLAAQRAQRKVGHQVDGLRQKLADVGRAQELRDRADLMLAYAHGVRRGAAEMRVPNLDGDGELTIPLDPKLPVAQQANKLYDKARRLDDGREVAEQRLHAAEAQHRDLAQVLDSLADDATPEQLEAARARLQVLGALPAQQGQDKPRSGAPRPGSGKGKPAGVPYRRFESAEGYTIFVGRNNAQNDELTMRFANGNDLWLHVGGGRPGSHVVVRLPKQKTASLETLLDAATLAVHFSKARGEARVDVIYTFKKHVRKPKGLPPGAVVPSHTRSVTVQKEEQRLRRLLDSAGEDAGA